MEITSVSFFLMMAISLVIYWHLPKRFQWYVLLVDSVIFYLSNVPAYTLIYVAVSLVSIYYTGRKLIAQSKDPNSAKSVRCFVTFTVILNIGILAVLKYTNLAIHTFKLLGGGYTTDIY